MPRGGKREGAGGVSTWKHGKTKTIRVPVALAERILAIARQIDDSIVPFDSDTGSKVAVSESKVIDLAGVSVTHVNGEIAVRLEDLVLLGYTLEPQHLAEMVEARIRRKHRK